MFINKIKAKKINRKEISKSINKKNITKNTSISKLQLIERETRKDLYVNQ